MNSKCASCLPGGELCTSGSLCCSGTCTNQTCTTCSTVGVSCTSDAQCCAGFSCLGGVCDQTCTATCQGWLAGTDSYASLCGTGKYNADEYIQCACSTCDPDCAPATCTTDLQGHTEDTTCASCLATPQLCFAFKDNCNAH